MKIIKIEINTVKLPFKEEFNHFLKSRSSTENLILKIYSENNLGIGEAIAREYVTEETTQNVINTIEKQFIPKIKNKKFTNITQVLELILSLEKKIKKNELSSFAAFSDSLLNLAAIEFNFKLENLIEYLKIPKYEKNKIKYSAVIGESSLNKTIIKCLLIKFRRFENVKIKISPNNLNQINTIRKILKKQTIYVDANCSINLNNINQVIEKLKLNNIKYIEQPFLINEKNKTKMYKLFKSNQIQIILDESFCLKSDISKINTEGDIVNLRINKNGGIIKTLLLYKELSYKNIEVNLGCMVGETVLTRENLIISRIIKTKFNEGNYDQFLFKNTIINNPKFKLNGIFDRKKNILDINQKVELTPNLNKYIQIKKEY